MRTWFAVTAVLVAAISALADGSWVLRSPDGRNTVAVSLGPDGGLSYEIFHRGKPALLKSPLGLLRDDEPFDCGLRLHNAGKVESRRETYELLAGPNPRVDQVYNRRTLSFNNSSGARLLLDLAAGDGGVAFRYRFPETSAGLRTIQTELTGFAIATNARGWLQPYHAAGPYTPAYEDFYFQTSPGDRPPHSREAPHGWSFPALFHVPDAKVWIWLSESGTDGAYCACHLASDSAGGIHRIAFPAADETTRGQTNATGPEPRWTLPWVMPWRVIALGDSAEEIALSTLVTDLAPPSRIPDRSWIRPGRASWSWWSYPDGPNDLELFNKFTDFAARMNWEYTLFDAGWWTPGLRALAGHAESKSVTPLAWTFAGDFYNARTRMRKLDEIQTAGARGAKVDFWCSDRQEAMAAMQALFEDAAARKLVINLHGGTIPRGWHRTWPHFLTAEAVLGRECYFFEPRYPEKAAELDTILPFVRSVAGPVDMTPAGCTLKKYARLTTAAHEFAAALIFTSGIIHYADSPEHYESLPSGLLQILRDAPARWDETRCLRGEPGRLAVFARRSGQTWFLAGLNGTAARLSIQLDLGLYREFSQRLLISEGADAVMEVRAAAIPAVDDWAHDLPARGGFILRCDPPRAP